MEKYKEQDRKLYVPYELNLGGKYKKKHSCVLHIMLQKKTRGKKHTKCRQCLDGSEWILSDFIFFFKHFHVFQ